MSLLLSVFGLLIAIYAIAPRERKLDFKLRFGIIGWSLASITFLAVLYLEFYDFFLTRHIAPKNDTWPVGLTPKNAVYIVLVISAVAILFRLRFSHLTRHKIRHFRDLAEQLLWSQRYEELISLLTRHLNPLFKIYHASFPLVHLRDRMLPPSEEQLQRPKEDSGDQDQSYNSIYKLIKPCLKRLARCLPTYERSQFVAQEVVHALFLSPSFIKGLTQIRPYFALSVLQGWGDDYRTREFFYLYLTELLQDSSSVLYAEIYNTQYLTDTPWYNIPSSNRLLYFLFSDVKVAEKYYVYEPIGSFVKRELDELARDPYVDPYNRATIDFVLLDAWRSPIYIAIHFFNIMVTSALYQGVESKMGLYYFPMFVERIVRNYQSIDPLADDDSGHGPLRYNSLAFKILLSINSWIRTVWEIPSDHADVVQASASAYDTNRSIPLSAIWALSACVGYLITSEKIDENFKLIAMEITLKLYVDLREGEFKGYATVLQNELVQGNLARYENDDKYLSQLRDLFSFFKEWWSADHNEAIYEFEQALAGVS